MIFQLSKTDTQIQKDEAHTAQFFAALFELLTLH